ncbi:hypothetical protein [Klebsiella aerogenes]|uniref:hypothetical protein n=1 Tax=Klebsiella aerogenes TaxID=548 RepID=UPI00339C58AC
MQEFKGTPGKWKYRGLMGRVYSDEHGVIADLMVSGREDEDGNLMAAAPELLEALHELFAHYKELADSGDAGNWKLEDQPVGKKAMAAIDKALGK